MNNCIIIQQDQPTSSTRSEPAINDDTIQFVGFKEMYTKTIEWEDHMSCNKAAEIAGDLNNELRNSFEDFQMILRRVSVKEETHTSHKKRQATLHDMFNKKS